MARQISFKTTREEMLIINSIVERALKLAAQHGADLHAMTTNMDVTVCHVNGCPLDLQRLLDAPDFDFLHDIFGIRSHINRKTGKLMDCFLPRCAQPQPSQELVSEALRVVSELQKQ